MPAPPRLPSVISRGRPAQAGSTRGLGHPSPVSPLRPARVAPDPAGSSPRPRRDRSATGARSDRRERPPRPAAQAASGSPPRRPAQPHTVGALDEETLATGKPAGAVEAVPDRELDRFAHPTLPLIAERQTPLSRRSRSAKAPLTPAATTTSRCCPRDPTSARHQAITRLSRTGDPKESCAGEAHARAAERRASVARGAGWFDSDGLASLSSAHLTCCKSALIGGGAMRRRLAILAAAAIRFWG